MMKKLFMLLLAMVGVLCLTACNYEVVWDINENGEVTATQKAWYSLDDIKDVMALEMKMGAGTINEESQAELEAIMNMETIDELLDYMAAQGTDVSTIETKEIDGITFMSDPSESSIETYSLDEYPVPDGYILTTDTIKLDFATTFDQIDQFLSNGGDVSEEDLETIEALKKMVYYDFTINMPKEILFTNGTLSKDKKSVNFKFCMADKDASVYVYTADSKDIISLSIGDAAYTKKKSIKITTPDKIKSVTVNGKESSGKKIDTSADGEYKVSVKTKYAEKKFTFIKDGTKPVVTGVENGKTYDGPVTITFSDETSGIKSAKLGKKKVKSGATITKAGTYTLKVTDKAGNKTTVKFTVK